MKTEKELEREIRELEATIQSHQEMIKGLEAKLVLLMAELAAK